MQFVLKGFSEEMGFRIFAFDGIAADRTHVKYTGKADLALTRNYGIRLQELPLLCRALLDGHQRAEDERAFTYTERTCASSTIAKRYVRTPRKKRNNTGP